MRIGCGVVGLGVAIAALALERWLEWPLTAPAIVLGFVAGAVWLVGWQTGREVAVGGAAAAVLVVVLVVGHDQWRVAAVVEPPLEPPTPSSRTITVGVADPYCTESFRGDPRMEVDETDRAVTIRAWVRRRWVAGCSDSYEPFGVTVELDAPFGDRELVLP